ncbi:MAG: 50S ribosomal protein L25 [Armatimonadetes bacterium]|jgi:large subunit ribosomal protein L25|nr:50S ribosomal protein L25 [Armatimonadota bacterium]
METLKLDALYRSDKSKKHRNSIRRQGYVTGSVFGLNLEPVPISLKLEDFVKQAKTAEAGTRTLIEMKITGSDDNLDSLVILKEFDKDPITRKVLDMQFQRINLKEKVTVNVPIELIGEAAGTAEGGIVEQVLDELHLSCLPMDIPPRIEVDIAPLGLGDLIRVGDLQLAEELEILADEDTLICSCYQPIVRVETPEVEEGAEGEEAVAEEAESTEEEAAQTE